MGTPVLGIQIYLFTRNEDQSASNIHECLLLSEIPMESNIQPLVIFPATVVSMAYTNLRAAICSETKQLIHLLL